MGVPRREVGLLPSLVRLDATGGEPPAGRGVICLFVRRGAGDGENVAIEVNRQSFEFCKLKFTSEPTMQVHSHHVLIHDHGQADSEQAAALKPRANVKFQEGDRRAAIEGSPESILLRSVGGYTDAVYNSFTPKRYSSTPVELMQTRLKLIRTTQISIQH